MNVVIQSLWHLYSFRENFMSYKNHRHSDKEIYLRVRKAAIIRERRGSVSDFNIKPQPTSHTQNQDDQSQVQQFDQLRKSDVKEESKDDLQNLNNRRLPMDDLFTKEDLEKLKQEIEFKFDKEVIKTVKQSDVCLYCNLLDLFTKYEYDQGKVLEPKKVRQSLEQIFLDQNEDFKDGKMGCAQETLEGILNYLHREYLFPNYIEQYLLMDKDNKFKLDMDLDGTGCSPKCPAHQTFGLDVCLISLCKSCKVLDDVQQIKRELVHQVYVSELFQTIKEYKLENDFTRILKQIIVGESDFHSQFQEPSICSQCKIPQKIQDKWLLEIPNIYTFNFQYSYIDEDSSQSRSIIKDLFNIIPNKIDLKSFLMVSEKSYQNTVFILRGMITYYGKHYISYFYSQKHDTWVQFNDQSLKSIGNFQEVMRRCINGKQQPTTLFYENQEVIINVIDTKTSEKDAKMHKKREKRYYFTDKSLQKNNFWIYTPKDGGKSNCSLFQ
ncbi:inactive ubiquitin carboxyl-terminal hydrolase 53-like [Stylonychia lemnae]|uniref:Inactive ubiquitin carboxyl-terminal hydrolase 53-like n=1 Tax=Stylonychia lemnae TaxID=5949 RepID=A0A078A2I6_STYLE|nr:inactive ubiquitin carboxyl-terminal hydrolase 53-like [Stylonychia lemnae]|eukprot:CDW76032.1 inactive ubiquitin carboxyl-terminal hydrolase 53-like [Stylonychia lemnae]